jgi:hypothetical protein
MMIACQHQDDPDKPGYFSQVVRCQGWFVLKDSFNSHRHRKVVPMSPIQLTHTGSEKSPIRIGIPVASLARWISATIPKIAPAMRSANGTEFMSEGFTLDFDPDKVNSKPASHQYFYK